MTERRAEIKIRKDIIGWEWRLYKYIGEREFQIGAGYALTRSGAIKTAKKKLQPRRERTWTVIPLKGSNETDD